MNYFEEFSKSRGLNKETWAFLNSTEESLLKDTNKFCEYLKKSKNIAIISDTDVDGITSGLLLFSILPLFGFNVYLHRTKLGKYGFDKEAIDSVVQNFPHVDTIITSDVGIGQLEEIKYAQEKGLTFIVTDHHIEVERSTAEVIVNPSRLDETYKFKSICGAMVVYKLLRVYALLNKPELVEVIDSMSWLAGLGTLADSMPLFHENRKVVKDLLMFLRNPKVTRNSTCNNIIGGIVAILKHLENEGRFTSVENIDATFVSFYIVPMINSVRRIGDSINFVYELFLTPNLHTKTQLTQELYNLNSQRKRLVENYLSDIELAENEPLNKLIYTGGNVDVRFAPFIYIISDVMPGLTGLIAGQLQTKSGLPTVVINGETLSGSLRSPENYKANTLWNSIGITCRGHEVAAGIMFKDLEEIERLHSYLEDTKVIEIEQPSKLTADVYINSEELNIAQLKEFYLKTRQLEPFGKGFPDPTILIDNFEVFEESLKLLGTSGDHFKVGLSDIEIISFYDKFRHNAAFVGVLGKNTFNGVSKLQLRGNLYDK